jgi:hypothetical protein
MEVGCGLMLIFDADICMHRSQRRSRSSGNKTLTQVFLNLRNT